MSKQRVDIAKGGENIFADLGLPDADNHFLKAKIVAELYRLFKDRKLTQAKAGALMGISQPEVSRLFKGHFREYSVDRLIMFLTAFDCDVEIVARKRTGRRTKKPERGHIVFKAAAA
jgi:predicted XRE-type DNA-binding protein